MNGAIESAHSLRNTDAAGRKHAAPARRLDPRASLQATQHDGLRRSGLRRLFRARGTACSDGVLRERAESI